MLAATLVQSRWHAACWCARGDQAPASAAATPGCQCHCTAIGSAACHARACCLPCRYKWMGFCPTSWVWWGGLLYVLGNLQYNIASTCSFAHNFPQQHQSWSADAVKWLVTVNYTSGGGFYLLAAVFFVLTDTGSKIWTGTAGPKVSGLICTIPHHVVPHCFVLYPESFTPCVPTCLHPLHADASFTPCMPSKPPPPPSPACQRLHANACMPSSLTPCVSPPPSRRGLHALLHL